MNSMSVFAVRQVHRLGVFVLLLLTVLYGPVIQAQAFPNKPVRVIVPTGAGGSNDLVARAIATTLGEIWGQSVLVDNRAGASGTIGADIVAKAPPNGYTIGLVASTFASVASMGGKLPFDSIRDFAPVSHVASAPWVVVVNPGLAAKTTAEFIQLAKKMPGKINYSSTGEGGAIHLAGELLKSMAGIDLQHVPYKSTVQGMNDVISGQVEMTITSVGAAMPHVTAGKLRALAVTGASRSRQAPSIPTIGETVPDYEFDNWFGVLAPRGTPSDIVLQIRDAMVRSLASREVSQVFAGMSIEPIGSSPAQFADKIRNEITKFSKLARDLGLRTD